MRLNRLVGVEVVFCFVLAMPILIMAESDADKAGSVGFKFLNLEYGARGAALGGLAAQASGAEATFWNPAGLAGAGGIGITASMTQWIVETNYMNAGVALPFLGGVVGLSFVNVDYGEIMKSGWAEKEGSFVFEADQGGFEASDAAVQLSYARFLSEKFSLGGTVKMLTEKIDTETINGFAFDLGTQFNTGFKDIRLGAVISNFGPDISPTQNNVPDISLPMTFTFGIVGQAFGDEAMGLVAGVNVLKYADAVQRFAFNGEFSVAGLVKLRGSYTLGTKQAPLSVGAGINLAGISADLGITSMTDFDAVTRISIGYQF